MYCKKCGKEVDDSAIMCPDCGAPTGNKEKSGAAVKVIGILLIIFGIIGIAMGSIMFGDIGIACMVGAIGALLSGIGFLQVNKKLR